MSLINREELEKRVSRALNRSGAVRGEMVGCTSGAGLEIAGSRRKKQNLFIAE